MSASPKDLEYLFHVERETRERCIVAAVSASGFFDERAWRDKTDSWLLAIRYIRRAETANPRAVAKARWIAATREAMGMIDEEWYFEIAEEDIPNVTFRGPGTVTVRPDGVSFRPDQTRVQHRRYHGRPWFGIESTRGSVPPCRPDWTASPPAPLLARAARAIGAWIERRRRAPPDPYVGMLPEDDWNPPLSKPGPCKMVMPLPGFDLEGFPEKPLFVSDEAVADARSGGFSTETPPLVSSSPEAVTRLAIVVFCAAAFVVVTLLANTWPWW